MISPGRDRVQCCVRLAPDARIDAVGVRAFLGPLTRQIRTPIPSIWDRRNTHRAQLIQRGRAAHPRVRVERWPPDAPELNPVELVWGHPQRNPLATYAPPDLDALVQTTRRRTRRLARNQPVLRALIRPCGLSLHLI